MNKVIISIVLAVAIMLLFFGNLVWGSVNIPYREVVGALTGNQTVSDTYGYIILESRLPQAITALLSGAALATSGLLLQTAFRNPLAGPDVFGISSGAGLAVAIVMLAFGGNISLNNLCLGFLDEECGYAIGGFMAILVSAFAGAMLVMGIILFFSTYSPSYYRFDGRLSCQQRHLVIEFLQYGRRCEILSDMGNGKFRQCFYGRGEMVCAICHPRSVGLPFTHQAA